MQKVTILLSSVLTCSSFALPIDWHGTFGVDSNVISTYNKLDRDSQSTAVIPDGSQEIPILNDHNTASFQSYLFKLSPTIIVNDSASIFAQFTTGYGYGGRFGDSSTHDFSGLYDVPLQYLTTSSNVPLTVSQLYMELYSDSAIWQIGRFSSDWALGAMVNSGKNSWDRYSFIRDGISANMKFSNFKFTPYWAIVSANSLTKADKITEKGISVLYDNSERDFSIGLLYGTRESGDQLTSEDGLAGNDLEEMSIKMLDLYLSKKMGSFSFAFEAPLMSGNLGKAYDNGQNSNYNAKAIVIETKYEKSNKWEFSSKLGSISGDDGNTSSFGALYLNPNYQVGKLIGRYNYLAFANSGAYSYTDAFLTNMKYAALYSKYKNDRYSFTTGFIFAQANEVAASGEQAYNHLTGKVFTAAADQSKNLGFELDFGMNYQWSKEISIGADLAYHFVGDYYTFSNDSSNELTSANALFLGLGVNITY